jgi:hypothetical protein
MGLTRNSLLSEGVSADLDFLCFFWDGNAEVVVFISSARGIIEMREGVEVMTIWFVLYEIRLVEEGVGVLFD